MADTAAGEYSDAVFFCTNITILNHVICPVGKAVANSYGYSNTNMADTQNRWLVVLFYM